MNFSSGGNVDQPLDSRLRPTTHVRPSDLPDVLVSHLEVETLYDTYAFFFDGENDGSAVVDGDRISVSVEPLQTLVLRVRFDG